MKTENKLTTLFKSGEKEQAKVSDQLVNDPRIDSPEIKVILPEQSGVSKTEAAKEPETSQPVQTKEVAQEQTVVKTKEAEEDKTYDQGFLDEFEVVATKEDKVEEPHVCEVGFIEAFKQNWLLLTTILVGLGIGCFVLGRVTKKVTS